MANHRANQSPSEKAAEGKGAKKRMSDHRAKQSHSEKAADREKNKKRMSNHRDDQSHSEKAADREKARVGMANLRAASSPSGKKEQADFSTPCLTCLEDEQAITFEDYEQNPETAAFLVHFNTGTSHWRDAYALLHLYPTTY